MQLTIRGALVGLAVVVASFWATLLVLDYRSDPEPDHASDPGVATSTPVPAPAPNTSVPAPAPSAPPAASAPTWNEALYLAVNADVAAAVARKNFKSGREHYETAGRAERRQGGFVPNDWDEAQYLRLNSDVAGAVAAGTFQSGYHHYLVAGRTEGRRGGFAPGRPPDK
jgi:hypothetical protein